MSQERADLNWYQSPPDYFATRPERPGVQSAQRPAGDDVHSTKDGPSHETEAGEFTFDDVLDIINPLHHLPVISSLYREITDDQISGHARIIGGGLFGGGAGFVAAIANAISEDATGRDLGGNLAAAVLGDETAPDEARAERQLVSTAPEPDGPEPTVAEAPSAAPALQGQAALDALYADLASGTSTSAPPPPVYPSQTEPAQAPPDKIAKPGGPPRVVGQLPAALPPAAPPLAAPPPPPAAPAVGGAGQIAPNSALFTDPAPAPNASGHKHEPEHGFTDRMLEGLKKYQDLMTGRQLSSAYGYRKSSPGH